MDMLLHERPDSSDAAVRAAAIRAFREIVSQWIKRVEVWRMVGDARRRGMAQEASRGAAQRAVLRFSTRYGAVLALPWALAALLFATAAFMLAFREYWSPPWPRFYLQFAVFAVCGIGIGFNIWKRHRLGMLLQEELAHPSPMCAQCGYSLAQLTSNRCPECGCEMDSGQIT
jgi:hypothetical protein